MTQSGAALTTKDFWRVNSYGYPNPFNRDSKAQEAWATFSSFYDHDMAAYSDLKDFWASSAAPRKLDNHAVESWKATFEEFGLLYVITRSNIVTITPGGQQLHEAAMQKNEEAFLWIGLHLLFRYPLKGPPRRNRNASHGASDLLLYRFLHSAMRDLGDYFWWTELERILCRVFSTTEAKVAVDAVRVMRANPDTFDQYPLPVANRKGAFYNSLNQVAVHAGLNHQVLLQENTSEHYGSSESRRRHFINRKYLSLVSAALGDRIGGSDCASSAMYVERLPTAPSFSDEQAYFDYLGAAVPTLGAAGAAAPLPTIDLVGDTVFLLKPGEHFQSVSENSLERRITGSIGVLCCIGRNQRVILADNLHWTYLVIGKELTGPNSLQLILRRARPITNVEPIETILGGDDA